MSSAAIQEEAPGQDSCSTPGFEKPNLLNTIHTNINVEVDKTEVVQSGRTEVGNVEEEKTRPTVQLPVKQYKLPVYQDA